MRASVKGCLAGVVVLLAVTDAPAQMRAGGGTGGTSIGGGGSTGLGGGSSLGGGTLGGSFGSFGSTFGSFGTGFGSGGSGGTGSGTGGSGFGAGGTGGGMGGRSSFSSGSPFARYLGNPLAAGAATGSANAQGNRYVRTFPVQLSFGQPTYDSAGVTRMPNTGITGLGGTLGGTTMQSMNRFAGASTMGVPRAPSYLSEPVFEKAPPPSMMTIRADLQEVVARSSRLPSRDNIRVLTDGTTIVLRGEVRDERERRLAEAVLRLSPGVREVRNELVPRRR